jgi:hypothetical protein
MVKKNSMYPRFFTGIDAVFLKILNHKVKKW